MKVFASVAAAAVVLAPSAFAQVSDQQIEARMSAAYNRCMDGEMSTAGMRDCASAEYRRQDAALNARYQAVMRGLNARQQGKLRAAQRAWVAFRTANCAAMADQDWGTLSLLAADSCSIQMTVARTIELEDYPPGEG